MNTNARSRPLSVSWFLTFLFTKGTELIFPNILYVYSLIFIGLWNYIVANYLALKLIHLMFTIDSNSHRFTDLQVYMLSRGTNKVSLISYVFLAGTIGLQVYGFTSLLPL